MSGGRDTRGAASATTAAAARSPVEYLPDREARNPALRWLLHLGLPVSISLLLHAVIAAVLIVTTWRVYQPPRQTEFEAGIAGAVDVGGGLKWPGDDPITFDAPPEITPAEPMKFSDTADLSTLLRSDAKSPDGAGEGGGFGFGDSGRSSVLGLGSGASTPGTGGLGSGSGLGSGLGRAQMWSVSASGDKFVYVLDFSGSMLVVEDELKREVKRSIGALSANQSFDVVVFFSERGQAGQGGGDNYVTESFNPQLVAATSDNRRKLFQWIDRHKPRGDTVPLAALKRALQLRPDAIFFFSDGDFDDRYVTDVAAENVGRKTQIHCLCFDDLLIQGGADKQLTKGALRLQKLAEQNGGKSKVITLDDLKR